MADSAAVKAFQRNPVEALTSANHGGLVRAACNGVWICPRYKDILYVCRGKVIGMCVAVLACHRSHSLTLFLKHCRGNDVWSR